MGTSPQIREPRVPFERAVWIGQANRPGRLQRVYAGNLSRGGMFLRVPEGISVGEPISVALGSRQEIIPLAQGEVVWQRGEPTPGAMEGPAGIGIAFRELAPDAPQLIDQLLESARAARTPPPLPAAEPITPPLHPAGALEHEPVTPISLLPPPRIPPLPPPLLPSLGLASSASEPSETRAFWSGFTLPARRRVQARLLSRELLLDFGHEAVESVHQEGNRITIVFVKPQLPV